MPQSSVQIICKRKGLKNIVKKIVWLQAYSSASGIWRQEGRQWVNKDGSKGRIKLAKLAQVLETFATWIQPKTAVIPTFDGDTITIPAGARLKRPARPFIMLWKVAEVWTDLRDRARAFIISYLNNRAIRGGKTHSKHVIDSITEQVTLLQKNRVTEMQTQENSQVTQKIKGFDFPLFDSGRLFNAIRGKTVANANRGYAQEQKLKFLTQIDRILADFNRK